MKQAIQFFDSEYLKNCKGMTPEQIVRYLEGFRLLKVATPSKKKLISLRISESLLDAVKIKAKILGVPYQTQIHRIIEDWVKS